MAWLKVSFPSVSGGGEALAAGSLARLTAVRFAKRSLRVFFAELFRALDFFMEPSVRIVRPDGASIVGAAAPVKSKWQIGHQGRPLARSSPLAVFETCGRSRTRSPCVAVRISRLGTRPRQELTKRSKNPHRN